MKTYVGSVVPGQLNWSVMVNDGWRLRPLALRLDLDNHSPDGFAWGYNGSGPAQLALALLADALRDDNLALAIHQRFKSTVVASWNKDEPFSITENEVSKIAGELFTLASLGR